jgi:hypothetical protein
MKNIHILGVSVVYIGSILISTASFSQQNWNLKYQFISIPARYIYFTTGHRDCPDIHDTTWSVNGNFHFYSSYGTTMPSPNSYARKGDTVYMTFSSTIVSFIIDSSLNTLLKFNMYDNNDPLNTSINFSSLHYNFINDSTAVVNDSGRICRSELGDISFNYVIQQECSFRSYYYSGNYLSNLIEDTTKYSCTLTLVLRKPASSIEVLNPTSEKFFSLISLFDQSYHFNIPVSNQLQIISFYDILGREIKRVDIPSGVSEYSIRQGELPSGYYFARLENMSAKFVVY